jgi:hypothetical protein
MHQQRLHSVAGGRIIRLRIQHNLHRLLQVRRRVQIHVTDPVRVAKHGDRSGALLDRSHQLVAPAWDDQIDVLVHLEEVGHLVAAAHQGDGVRAAIVAQRLLDQPHEDAIAVGRLLAALHEEAVGAGDGQRGHLRQRVRPRLENDEQDPDGNGPFEDFERVGDLRWNTWISI